MSERSIGLWDQLKIYALPVAAVVLGLTVSFVLYWQLNVLDDQNINDQFSRLAQEQSKHLQWNLTNYRNALHSTVDLFNSTERVELTDFQRIANLIENRYPEVLALEWLPKVTNDERQSFVDSIRQQYDVNYELRELDEAGDLVEARPRQTYYPVTYIHPFQGAHYNQRILGFDHFSQMNRRRAIKKARNQGSITITPSMVFFRTGFAERDVQSPANNLGVILYKPVFTSATDREDVEGQHEKPVGVIALSLKVQSVMAPVFEAGDFGQNVAVIEHASDPNNPNSRLIYSNRPLDEVNEFMDEAPDISFRERFPVSDRSWSVLLWPTQQYVNARGSWAPLLALAFGLLFTGILTRGAYWMSGEFLGRRREFYSVIDSAEDAIISTNQDGRIRLWNSAAREIFGYEKDDVTGKPVTKILAEDDREDFGEMLNREGTGSIDGKMMDLNGMRSTGERFPIELTLSKWEGQGEVFYTIIVRDVTERKKRENRLQELTKNLEEKVKNRTQELEQFVYAASHDLREPARVMQTYAGFLEEDLGGELNDNVRKDLRFIRDSASQMNDLIDSLLTLSRIGQGEIELEDVDVNHCVDQALEQQEELIKTSDVSIERDDLPQVQADPALLTDLYQNLLVNAVKHGGNGEIEIRLTAERNGDNWILGVRDRGPGISPEYQDKIFEPFKHLSQSDKQDGTGIGLSICRRIVERHDGDIWVDSQPGEGAHFRFTLG